MTGVHGEKSGDADNNKDRKKPSGIISPWTTKTSNLRSEMEAEGYREQEKKEVFMVRQEQQRVYDEIRIVKMKLQWSKQKGRGNNHIRAEMQNADKMKAKNEQLTKNIELKDAQIGTLSKQLQQLEFINNTV
ncbi:hypothetical protein RFI_03311 [Reticulomyxa filosa]|uniref:Uncharacterized protein n=1 Tax=Reticulomyxa filosa TaxID=46433 RepID=X6P835_RETFI|nr:hypothetical protein RFI_03311 [Reticulomyxa filosa]|eukprot:ETO33792.1 hypothetical protein RFI_03311 [Reticulomyxa filosa]